MLNQLKEETAARILRDIPADGPIRKSVIDNSAVPENLRQFLVRMLERRVELAMRESFEGAEPWFDSSSSVARDLMSDLMDTARESARFPCEEWADAVRRATDMVVRYAVRPVDTLVLFAFGVDGDSIRSADLRRCVRFFRDHRPMRRAVIHFLDGHPSDPVSRADFEEGLRHIYDRLTSENAADQWIEALEPLKEITTYSGLKRESVPVEGAVILFRHLGLEDVANRIEEEARLRDAVFVKCATLDQLIRSELSIDAEWSSGPDVSERGSISDGTESSGKSENGNSPKRSSAGRTGRDVNSEWAPGPGWSPPIPFDVKSEPERVSSPESTGKSDAVENEGGDAQDSTPPDVDETGAAPDDVPLWKQFQPEEPRSRAAELEGGEAPLWKKYREDRPTTGSKIAAEATVRADADTHTDAAAATNTAGGLVALEKGLLGERADSRSRYVRILFKGDTDAYAETLAMLSEVTSWDQASKILSRHVFRRFEVDIYGDAAVEFTDALERSFGN